MGFEDGFIADGSFIDPISDNWKAGNNINIAYKAHNRVLLRSNMKMDHWYRSMKDLASWRDYESRQVGSPPAVEISKKKLRKVTRPQLTSNNTLFDLVGPVDHIVEPPK